MHLLGTRSTWNELDSLWKNFTMPIISIFWHPCCNNLVIVAVFLRSAFCWCFCLVPRRTGGLEVGWWDVGMSVCQCVFLTNHIVLDRSGGKCFYGNVEVFYQSNWIRLVRWEIWVFRAENVNIFSQSYHTGSVQPLITLDRCSLFTFPWKNGDWILMGWIHVTF